MPNSEELAREWLAEFEKPAEAREGTLLEHYDQPEVLWEAILLILEHDLTDSQFSSLAAGPMEDLLARHGPAFIERVEDLAASKVQ